MEYTRYFQFKKPELSDEVSPTPYNDNFDSIDTKINTLTGKIGDLESWKNGKSMTGDKWTLIKRGNSVCFSIYGHKTTGAGISNLSLSEEYRPKSTISAPAWYITSSGDFYIGWANISTNGSLVYYFSKKTSTGGEAAKVGSGCSIYTNLSYLI